MTAATEPEKPPASDQKRYYAMDMALRAQRSDDTPAAIVARARAFLQFLTGEDDPAPPPAPGP